MKQSIHIIGGTYRGKKLPFADIEGLRPTPNRVRETVFNWLMHDVHDARCLDTFAGSGALGFEAFSRGAAKVTFIEQAPAAQTQILKLITQFNSPKLNLIKTDAMNYLQQGKESYDLIFLDPPFTHNLIPQCLHYLAAGTVLAAGGLVYIESSEPVDFDSHQWEQFKMKKAGQVHFGLLRKI